MAVMSRWTTFPNDDSSSSFPLFLCVSSSLGFFLLFLHPFSVFPFPLLLVPSQSLCFSPLCLCFSIFYLWFVLFFFFPPSLCLSLSLFRLAFLFPLFFLFPLLSACWVGYLYDRGSKSFPTFVQSWRQGRVARVASMQSLQPQSMISLSNLHHGGKWGAWVVSGEKEGIWVLQRRGRKTFFPCLWTSGKKKIYSVVQNNTVLVFFLTVYESVLFWTKRAVSYKRK